MTIYVATEFGGTGPFTGLADLAGLTFVGDDLSSETLAIFTGAGATELSLPLADYAAALDAGQIDFAVSKRMDHILALLEAFPDARAQVYDGGTGLGTELDFSDFLVAFGNRIFQGTTDDDALTGSPLDELFYGLAGNDTLLGDAGDDTVLGGPGENLLDGGRGNDIVEAGADADDILGGTGDDTINGGNGENTLKGGKGDDVITGGAQVDIIRGQDGADSLDGGSDDDNVKGGGGEDTLTGGNGADYLAGGTRNDLVMGDEGDDKLLGNAHDDTLLGGDGDDILKGGGENDVLNGGNGSDVLKGGDGDDVFVFDNHSGVETEDKILDFDVTLDRLSIDRTLADGVTAATLASNAQVGAAGVVIEFTNGDTILLEGLTTTDGLQTAIELF